MLFWKGLAAFVHALRQNERADDCGERGVNPKALDHAPAQYSEEDDIQRKAEQPEGEAVDGPREEHDDRANETICEGEGDDDKAQRDDARSLNAGNDLRDHIKR